MAPHSFNLNCAVVCILLCDTMPLKTANDDVYKLDVARSLGTSVLKYVMGDKPDRILNGHISREPSS